MQALPPPQPGVYFVHHDWELACDNTRTCRAAGYQLERSGDDAQSALPVSVLITRAAGPGVVPTGQLRLGDIDDAPQAPASPSPPDLRMRVNGRDLGPVRWTAEPGVAQLSAAQVQAMVAALPRPQADVRWVEVARKGLGARTWQLSDQGVSAVFLKMDEVQGRLGTTGALLRKGPAPDTQAWPPVPAPVVVAAPVPPDAPAGRAANGPPLDARAMAALRRELEADTGDDGALFAADTPEGQLALHPLGQGRWLVEALCWRAAYNEGSCHWVIQGRAPHRPVRVTTMGSSYVDGVISSDQKGRGLGDCMAHEDWTWTGQRFAYTSSYTTGLCRLVTPGGAWVMPTWVTTVKAAGSGAR